ncbi:hypothetical protein LWI28_017321 [Acer negundo]|uniref:Reverse transcriptase domain-containing protein n=1 Tax=Acer negundo TaxID=4023 RepID=A0AAD5J578_ACENE|nr:hypothetical protein LWI28_017321 [Acer negundo]
MYVDYTDLNRAYPKDSFPLPKIDQLIDSTAGNKLLSFMDAFSGYNQIMMHPSDQDKTSFITRQGLYCYKVMPFELKNASSTYQRMVNKLFKKQIGRSIEVYIDDMITKSLEAGKHPEDLRQTFQVFRKNQMRLNPAKYAFGVAARKFLGFMVHKRGIEANPKKIKAILDLKSPTTLKQAQGLTGRITTLNRFISRSTDKCLLFFKIIKQGKKVKWDEQSELAFHALKEYLANPHLLVKPLTGEELQLYIVVLEGNASRALVKEYSDGIQRPVYYVSRAFTKSENNYTLLEKLAYALRPDVLGRLVLWALELSQFDIKYKPRSTIKAQALADFVMEFGINPDPITKPDPSPNQTDLNWPEDNKTWILYTDEASSQIWIPTMSFGSSQPSPAILATPK